MRFKRIFIFMASAALLAGCGGGSEIKPDLSLQEMYENAYKKFDNKNYEEASTAFVDVERAYPASPWAAAALVMGTYSAYMDDDFAGALLISDQFMRFHPGHKDVPYIMYLRGMCYWRQVSDVRREPGMSVYALNAFQGLVQRFPDTEYAKNAENKIKILENYIAGKQMYLARSDMQDENWTSAIDRLQSVVVGANQTVMTAEALYRLTEAYTAIGLPEQAAGYANMLRKNYPDSEWTKKLSK